MIVDGRIDLARYLEIRSAVFEAGHHGDYVWSQTLKPPETPEDLAREYTFVVINSGMKATVARGIFMRVWRALIDRSSASSEFGHKGKAEAIERFWGARASKFYSFRDAADPIAWCESQAWIGAITKYHLAKNLGVDCAKPDRWLVRLADLSDETPEQLCVRLAVESGDRIATVDVVLWRACAVGLVRPLPKVPGAAAIVLDLEKASEAARRELAAEVTEELRRKEPRG